MYWEGPSLGKQEDKSITPQKVNAARICNGQEQERPNMGFYVPLIFRLKVVSWIHVQKNTLCFSHMKWKTHDFLNLLSQEPESLPHLLSSISSNFFSSHLEFIILHGELPSIIPALELPLLPLHSTDKDEPRTWLH